MTTSSRTSTAVDRMFDAHFFGCIASFHYFSLLFVSTLLPSGSGTAPSISWLSYRLWYLMFEYLYPKVITLFWREILIGLLTEEVECLYAFRNICAVGYNCHILMYHSFTITIRVVCITRSNSNLGAVNKNSRQRHKQKQKTKIYVAFWAPCARCSVSSQIRKVLIRQLNCRTTLLQKIVLLPCIYFLVNR